MVNVGVIGEEASEVDKILNKLCFINKNEPESDNKYKMKVHYLYDTLENNNEKTEYDIVIINRPYNFAEKFISLLTPNDVLLINSDNKKINKCLKNNKAKIITYGLNNRACVTASSVVESQYKTVQCCVQRSLPTFKGEFIFQQEFSVNSTSCYVDVNCILACVTAAIINDVPIDKITGVII